MSDTPLLGVVLCDHLRNKDGHADFDGHSED